MAGHTGMERVTIKNLEVVEVNKENRLILVNGAVPGMRGTKIIVRK
jgi:large subunit ribosomal protein L3